MSEAPAKPRPPKISPSFEALAKALEDRNMIPVNPHQLVLFDPSGSVPGAGSAGTATSPG